MKAIKLKHLPLTLVTTLCLPNKYSHLGNKSNPNFLHLQPITIFSLHLINYIDRDIFRTDPDRFTIYAKETIERNLQSAIYRRESWNVTSN